MRLTRSSLPPFFFVSLLPSFSLASSTRRARGRRRRNAGSACDGGLGSPYEEVHLPVAYAASVPDLT
eukprot:1686546-Rhodomonas_salina.1